MDWWCWIVCVVVVWWLWYVWDCWLFGVWFRCGYDWWLGCCYIRFGFGLDLWWFWCVGWLWLDVLSSCCCWGVCNDCVVVVLRFVIWCWVWLVVMLVLLWYWFWCDLLVDILVFGVGGDWFVLVRFVIGYWNLLER